MTLLSRRHTFKAIHPLADVNYWGFLPVIVVALVAAIAAATVATHQEVEAYHDTWNPETLTPHHTYDPGSYYYETRFDPYLIVARTRSHTGADEAHFTHGLAQTIDAGFMARARIYLPDHAGTLVNVSMSNASAFVEVTRINATAPYEAAAALPVRTGTVTVLGSASAPAVDGSPHVLPLTATPVLSDGHLATDPTGLYPGVSSPRHAIVPYGESQVYVHNAGSTPLNVTIAGPDGSDHSQLIRGSSSHVLPVGDYNYSIAAPGYPLAWNGTIRTLG